MYQTADVVDGAENALVVLQSKLAWQSQLIIKHLFVKGPLCNMTLFEDASVQPKSETCFQVG